MTDRMQGAPVWPLVAGLACAVVACATPPRETDRPAPGAACGGVAAGHSAAGLYYECSGGGDDVVVLIPAFSMDRRMWAAEVALLSRSFRVIAYDPRGHGLSTAPMEPYSAAGDLLALMDELAVDAAHLIGLSNGARIALDLALLQPARVRSLVLAASGVGGSSGGDFSYMAPVIEAVRAGDLERAAGLWAATPLMHIPDDPAAAMLVRTISHDNRHIWSHRENPERPLHPPAIDRLGDIHVPVLVVTGDRDLPDLLRLADLVAESIPGAARRSIPGAGHMVNLAAPVAFDSAMMAFLRVHAY